MRPLEWRGGKNRLGQWREKYYGHVIRVDQKLAEARDGEEFSRSGGAQ